MPRRPGNGGPAGSEGRLAQALNPGACGPSRVKQLGAAALYAKALFALLPKVLLTARSLG